MQNTLQPALDAAENVQSTINEVAPQPTGADEPATSLLEEPGDVKSADVEPADNEAQVLNRPPASDVSEAGSDEAEGVDQAKKDRADALDVAGAATQVDMPESEPVLEDDLATAESRSVQAVPTKIPSEKSATNLPEGSSIEAAGGSAPQPLLNQPHPQESAEDVQAPPNRAQQPKESHTNAEEQPAEEQPIGAVSQPGTQEGEPSNRETSSDTESTVRGERLHKPDGQKHDEPRNDSAAGVGDKSTEPRDKPSSDKPFEEPRDDRHDEPTVREADRDEKDEQNKEPSAKSNDAPAQGKDDKPKKR